MVLLSENEFLIQAKASLSILGLLGDELKADMFFLGIGFGIGLSREVAEVYSQELNAPVDSVGKIYRIKPQKPEDEIVIYGHESGPEVFLIPLASFVAGSVASGVVGNLAYDILKDLYRKAREALMNLVEERSQGHWSTPMIDEEELVNRIQIELITPDGMVRVEFDEGKGLSPEIVRFLARRIERYIETHPYQDRSDVV